MNKQKKKESFRAPFFYNQIHICINKPPNPVAKTSNQSNLPYISFPITAIMAKIKQNCSVTGNNKQKNKDIIIPAIKYNNLPCGIDTILFNINLIIKNIFINTSILFYNEIK